MRRFLILSALLVILAGSALVANAQVRPPEQPLAGPGGSQLPHAAVTKNKYDKDGEEYWLYEPDSPRPKSAPVIVFLHGWGGTNPAIYGAWIDHIVRRGNIVIFPRYQEGLLTPFKDFTPNSLTAIKNAVKRLETEDGRVRPDLDKFATVGHSMGGLLAANIAALAHEHKLPQVRAMMSVEPGITWNPIGFLNQKLADLSKLPSETLLLAVAGDNDRLTGSRDAKRIYYESTKIPASNKDFITLVSDDRGKPALEAGHSAPRASDQSYDNNEKELRRRAVANANGQAPRGTGRGVDALDFYGLWKLFDALCDAAFYGRNREYALGDTPQQRFMGKWSDGRPVKELKVTDRP